jgi:hypothetical protein
MIDQKTELSGETVRRKFQRSAGDAVQSGRPLQHQRRLRREPEIAHSGARPMHVKISAQRLYIEAAAQIVRGGKNGIGQKGLRRLRYLPSEPIMRDGLLQQRMHRAGTRDGEKSGKRLSQRSVNAGGRRELCGIEVHSRISKHRFVSHRFEDETRDTLHCESHAPALRRMERGIVRGGQSQERYSSIRTERCNRRLLIFRL